MSMSATVVKFAAMVVLMYDGSKVGRMGVGG